MGITLENKNTRCGKGLAKGSPASKEWAKKMLEARSAKKELLKQTEPKVKIEIMGQSQLILPDYFAIKRKNGYKLVNPLTQERNLSKRNGETSIRIIRKPVENAVLLEGKDELIPLSLFSKKDRELITQHFDKIEQNKEKPVEEKPVIQMPKPKERGRPERLPKNIEINKQRNAGKAKKGRPSKYKSQEEAKAAKVLSDKARYAKKQEDKKKAKEQVEGTGVMSDVGDIINAGNRKIKKTINRVSSVVKQLVYGANELPKQVQEILKKYGDENISSITIMRTPVPEVLTGALSLFSGGEFGKRMKEKSFDELFHLFLELKMASGKRVLLEKNDRINMVLNPPSRPKTEKEPITEEIPEGLTLNTILSNTDKLMGKSKFLGYSAKDNNCQDFLVSILKANHLGDSGDMSFIKQDTKTLFKNLPYLRKLANTITDIGANVNTIISGGGNGDEDDFFKQHFNYDDDGGEFNNIEDEEDVGYGLDDLDLIKEIIMNHKKTGNKRVRTNLSGLTAEEKYERMKSLKRKENMTAEQIEKKKETLRRNQLKKMKGRGLKEVKKYTAEVEKYTAEVKKYQKKYDDQIELLRVMRKNRRYEEDMSEYYEDYAYEENTLKDIRINLEDAIDNLNEAKEKLESATIGDDYLIVGKRQIDGRGASASVPQHNPDGRIHQLERELSIIVERMIFLSAFINNPDNSLNPRLQSIIRQLDELIEIRQPLVNELNELYLDIGYELGDEEKDPEGGGIRKNNILGNNIRMEKTSDCSSCPICGSGGLKKIGKTFKNVGKDIASGLIHKALPKVVSGLAGSATTALTGNPALGLMVEETAGKAAGKKAGNMLGDVTGLGLKKPNAWIELVKKVQKEKGVSYKEAMSIASQMKKKN